MLKKYNKLPHYFHVGSGHYVAAANVIGIFDTDRCTVSKRGKDFLYSAQREKRLIETGFDIPKSFIVLADNTVYLSDYNTATIV